MRTALLQWYRANKRELPWRSSKDPYRIWISEVMLQQTTVVAVIPYYERFLNRFPTVSDLADATEPQVLEMWAGLGYYSRARNLHKAAKLIQKNKFPQSAAELIQLPGFGPYTSRAVASLAFDEPVGVLDGNVIRILTRVHGLKLKWWLPKERQKLQDLADQLAKTSENADLNQAMMELGATICTPQKPLCLLCPWKVDCSSLAKDLIQKVPLKRPRPKKEVWLWTMKIHKKKNLISLEENRSTPFLNGMLFPAGKARPMSQKPKKFDIRHSVTKYEIYVQLKITGFRDKKLNWYPLENLKKVNHSSLMSKILKKL